MQRFISTKDNDQFIPLQVKQSKIRKINHQTRHNQVCTESKAHKTAQ